MRAAAKRAICYALFRLPHRHALRLVWLVLRLWPGFRGA